MTPAGTAPVTSMDGRTVVITGGNSGIGLETAAALAAAGAKVVMGCRNPSKADAAVTEIRRRSSDADVQSRPLDLADLASVETFADSLDDLDRIDVLINNAGLMLDERHETAQGHEAVFGTNHLGPFHLTNKVLPRIVDAPAGRIITVASIAHRMAPFGLRWNELDRTGRFDAWSVYAESKLANVLHSRALARRLEGTAAVAHALHPGSIASGFGREGDLHGFNGWLLNTAAPVVLISPERGAETSTFLASSPVALRTSGDYWSRGRKSTASRAGRDDGAAERLWALSEQLVAG